MQKLFSQEAPKLRTELNNAGLAENLKFTYQKLDKIIEKVRNPELSRVSLYRHVSLAAVERLKELEYEGSFTLRKLRLIARLIKVDSEVIGQIVAPNTITP